MPVLTVALTSWSAGAGTSRPRMINARCNTDYADEDVSVTADQEVSATIQDVNVFEPHALGDKFPKRQSGPIPDTREQCIRKPENSIDAGP